MEILEILYNIYPFNTTPDPNYIGGREDHAHAEALISSILEFLNTAQEGDFPWPQLLPSNYNLFYQDHKHMQELLKGLLTVEPSKRMTAEQTLDFIKRVTTKKTQ